MDESLRAIHAGARVRSVGPRRERRRREDEPAFRLEDAEPAPATPEEPAAAREERPLAARGEDEPGASLDLSA